MDVLNPAFRRPSRLTRTSNAQGQSQAASGRPGAAPKPTKHAHVAPHMVVSRPASQSLGKKASSAQPRPKSQTAAKHANPAARAREGSKAAKVLGLLRRPDGASLKELINGLVGAFCPWVSRRHCEQADGAQARVHEERGRGAPLLRPRLNPHKAISKKRAAEVSPGGFSLLVFPVGRKDSFTIRRFFSRSAPPQGGSRSRLAANWATFDGRR
jgi:hypothetical protein